MDTTNQKIIKPADWLIEVTLQYNHANKMFSMLCHASLWCLKTGLALTYNKNDIAIQN